MVEPSAQIEPLQGAGLTVHRDETLQAATLRYFGGDGAFAAALREVSGVALPEVLRATSARGGEIILAWRSPTETLLLAGELALSELEARLAQAADGCLVNLTGGLKVLRVTGEGIPDLLCRLGGTGSIPQLGEARRSRMADVPVLVLSVRPGEALLLVDRAYAEHLMGWIRETLLDFAGA